MLGLKLPLLLGLTALLLLLRWRRVGMLTWAIAWWLAVWTALTFGFQVPIPQSVINIYMAIVTGSLLAYIVSSRDRFQQATRPIVQLVVEPRYRLVLVMVLLAIPLLVAWRTYAGLTVPVLAPSFGRTVHPAPPDEITVGETKINLITSDNPYRHLEKTEPEAFRQHLENGRRVYFSNCFYCHGDAMAGDGMFIEGLNPIPTNFTDAGVLPQLQESFLFWRVAKGAPGLPEEGGPWDSAMPAWENFLTVEEMWDVVAYLYDYTNYRPRAQAVH